MVIARSPQGLYCAAGDFWVDPWRPVSRALITHAHADHARPGHGHYLATPKTAAVMRHRLGDIAVETLDYGVPLRIGGARVSFHPAGHVPGSAQIRIEVGGEVWVVSGDYKTVPDGLSEAFEPVRCHGFVSECTFGLPIFTWPEQAVLAAELNAWWAACAAQGQVAILGAYALGKAQRLMALADASIGPIRCHGAVAATNAVLADAGLALSNAPAITADTPRAALKSALVIAPPAALGSAWARGLGPRQEGFASGWMRLRGVRRRRGVGRGFVISDHADWPGLTAAIAATGAERVWVTHGYTTAFCRYLQEAGLDAEILETAWEGERAEPEAATP